VQGIAVHMLPHTLCGIGRNRNVALDSELDRAGSQTDGYAADGENDNENTPPLRPIRGRIVMCRVRHPAPARIIATGDFHAEPGLR